MYMPEAEPLWLVIQCLRAYMHAPSHERMGRPATNHVRRPPERRGHLCAWLQYAKIVQKLGFPATFKEFKIQNIVGSCDVKFPIRLEGLAYAHSLFASVSRPWFMSIAGAVPSHVGHYAAMGHVACRTGHCTYLHTHTCSLAPSHARVKLLS